MRLAAAPTPPAIRAEETRQAQERRRRQEQRPRGRDLWSGLLLAFGFLAAAVPLALFLDSGREPSPATYGSLIVAYGLAYLVSFEVGYAAVVPTQLILVPMFFVLPVGTVPLCVAAGTALALIVGRNVHWTRASYVSLSNAWFSIGPALVLGFMLEAPRFPNFGDWPIYLLALAAQFAFDYARSALRPWLVLRISPRRHARAIAQAYLVDAALAPIGFAVAFVAFFDPVAVVLVVPLVGLLAYFSRERRARIDHALELGRAYRGTALLLGDVVEADDTYTAEHSRDVVSLVLAVADLLDLDEERKQEAEFVALLHDVGKIQIPNEIINKPGPLTPEERAVVEQHTVIGEQMLGKVGGLLGKIGQLVRSCHEHWDGSGYPDGLAGEKIPLVSRIVCCCDAYSAMTTTRPYRKARTPAVALAELRRCAGTQFDPVVVDAVAAVIGKDDVRAAAA
jgi:HD-GYP domain-containing protein (c-di-GMP phosphodiesterase class II)